MPKISNTQYGRRREEAVGAQNTLKDFKNIQIKLNDKI